MPKTIIVSFGLLILIAFFIKKETGEEEKNMFFVPVFKHAVCITSSNGFTQKVMHLLRLSDFLLIKHSTWRNMYVFLKALQKVCTSRRCMFGDMTMCRRGSSVMQTLHGQHGAGGHEKIVAGEGGGNSCHCSDQRAAQDDFRSPAGCNPIIITTDLTEECDAVPHPNIKVKSLKSYVKKKNNKVGMVHSSCDLASNRAPTTLLVFFISGKPC